jgi:hypothetical protein
MIEKAGFSKVGFFITIALSASQSERARLLMIPRVNLPRFDRYVQAVLLRRKSTGSVIGKGTGRTVRFVKVNEYFAVLMCIRVMITAGGIRGISIGQVHELDEEPPVW